MANTLASGNGFGATSLKFRCNDDARRGVIVSNRVRSERVPPGRWPFRPSFQELTMRILTALMLSLGLTPFVSAADFALTGENTKIEFTGKKADGKHDGGFKKLTGTATVPDGKIENAKLEVTIETDSIWSDNPGLTTHLKAADFFDVKTNPTAKFVSTKIAGDGDKFNVTGDLTLNGKTKSITFPAKIAATAGTFTLTAAFKIDRTQFGMAYGKGKIEDEVDLKVNVDAKK
jgi:polyisoprenoid-binding protein YceI